MMIRSIVIALATALVMTCSGPASAQQQAKCMAGKTKCMSTKAGGLLKCEETAETPGKLADQSACIAEGRGQVRRRYRLHQGLLREAREQEGQRLHHLRRHSRGRGRGRQLRRGFVAAIDPPPTTQSKCLGGKKKCVAKLLGVAAQVRRRRPRRRGRSTDTSACDQQGDDEVHRRRRSDQGLLREARGEEGERLCGPQGQLGRVADAGPGPASRSWWPWRPPRPTDHHDDDHLDHAVGRDGPEGRAAGHPRPLQLQRSDRTSRRERRVPGDLWHHGTHVCTYAELQTAQASGRPRRSQGHHQRARSRPSGRSTPRQPPSAAVRRRRCWAAPGSTGSTATAHTRSRGDKVPLDNATGTLGALAAERAVQHRGARSWVGCCQ